MTDEPRVVEAVASMVSHGVLDDSGTEASAQLNRRIVDAMVAAVQKAQADGVTDPDLIRQAQLDARDAVLAG